MKRLNLVILLYIFAFAVFAQNDTAAFYTITGKVTDAATKKSLSFVSIRLTQTNIATVSNTEGDFVLKIPLEYGDEEIIFSHLGYEPDTLLRTYFNKDKQIVRLRPAVIALDEVEILRGDASGFIKEVFNTIPQNYPQQANQMVGFYRETVRKNNRYISVTEAVLDIYKSPYNALASDQARIYKARRSTDMNNMDTIFVKYKGGVTTALELDMAKHYAEIFFDDFTAVYDFYFEGITDINNRTHHIIAFNQKNGIDFPLFRGYFYIDALSKAIAKVEFNMNVENNEKATPIFIHKKPAGMRVNVTEAAYIIQFTEQDGKWFYEYSRATLTFKCRWEKRWFHSTYILQSEMAVTDRASEGINKFNRKERLRPNDIIAEKITDFEDKDFWEGYNIIEPEQKIENAIKRLSGKLKKSNL